MEVRLAIFKKRLTHITRAVAALAVAGAILPVAVGAESLSDRIDELSNSLDDIESKVQSTMLSGGSSPVSFSGEARLKMQYHNLGFDAPWYMQADRSYLQSGWEGNENLFRLGMIVRPGRNTVLWSKIGFQHTLTGNRYYDAVRRPDREPGYDYDTYSPYQYRQDKVRNSITIHEDMNAGIAVRTVPFSLWVKLGNTLWTEASPLTVWKAQPRTFAWEYLPFEVEQPIARYYEYNIARGEKSGRAAWNKKPFNGINVESINLPWDLYANVVYGTFERYDNFEREFIDFAGDLGYADGSDNPFPSKGHGVGDSYRHVVHARLAKSKFLGDMILGLNYVGINYKEDVLYSNKEGGGSGLGSGTYHLLVEFRGNDSVFYKEPKTLSADIKGPINDKFSIHLDVAVNMTDTVWLIDPDETHADGQRRTHPEWYTEKSSSSSDFFSSNFVPAIYTKLTYNNDVMPIEADLVGIGKGFYSPFSFAVPMDAFFAYGANMVGAGKFIARGEGSPYAQNMAGANLTFSPKLPGYGHFRVKYGQHFNIEKGQDVLYFPSRLNGSDMFSFFHSSFNRWGNNLIDNSVKAGRRTYKGRLGDESYYYLSSYNTNLGLQRVAGPNAGGLRSDYLAMFEGFVPYNSAEEAYNNHRMGSPSNNPPPSSFYSSSGAFYRWEDDSKQVLIADSTMSTRSAWIPENRKYTANFELDGAYDVGPLIGYRKDLFFGGYFGFNSVSRSVKWQPFSEQADDMLLWSFYMRLEPAIALHKNFYLLGLLGYETWRSKKSWMIVDNDGRYVNPLSRYRDGAATGTVSLLPDNFINVPIDYRDWAYGLGFDWDMLERVGLHGRVKWISHEDRGLNNHYKSQEIEFSDRDGNDWMTPVFSLEIKTWF